MNLHAAAPSQGASPEPTLRVTMVTPALEQGGANPRGTPAHILKVSRGLRELGVEVSLLETGVDRPFRVAPGHRATSFSQAAWRLPLALSELAPHVVHAHGYKAAAAALLPARLLGVPLVAEPHGVPFPSRRGQPGARPWRSALLIRAEFPVLRRADLVIAQAEAMRSRLLHEGGVDDDRVVVLYPGVAVTEFSGFTGAPARVPGRRDGEAVVLYAGTTERYQGLDLLARAQPLLAELGVKARVVLVLSDAATDDAVWQLGFDRARTTLVRPSSNAELPAWFAAADVLVHARPDVPDNQNVQSKLGLYLASGKPVVATGVGDYAALLSDRPGAIVVHPEPRSLADGLARAATDPRVATGAREAGPALARERFDLHGNLQRLLGLYRRLAGGGRLP